MRPWKHRRERRIENSLTISRGGSALQRPAVATNNSIRQKDEPVSAIDCPFERDTW